MWEPRRLTTLWASTACYRDSFPFLHLPEEEFVTRNVLRRRKNIIIEWPCKKNGWNKGVENRIRIKT
jgi:hypothetical protein